MAAEGLGGSNGERWSGLGWQWSAPWMRFRGVPAVQARPRIRPLGLAEVLGPGHAAVPVIPDVPDAGHHIVGVHHPVAVRQVRVTDPGVDAFPQNVLVAGGKGVSPVYAGDAGGDSGPVTLLRSDVVACVEFPCSAGDPPRGCAWFMVALPSFG